MLPYPPSTHAGSAVCNLTQLLPSTVLQVRIQYFTKFHHHKGDDDYHQLQLKRLLAFPVSVLFNFRSFEPSPKITARCRMSRFSLLSFLVED